MRSTNFIRKIWNWFDLWKLLDFAEGGNVRQHYDFLVKSQFWSKEKIKKYQIQKLRRIVNWSYNTVPYYHKLFNSIGYNPNNQGFSLDLFYKIPILCKKEIQKDYTQFVSKYKFRHMITKTSGSTGLPTNFLRDKNTISIGDACFYRFLSWFGFQFGDPFVTLWGRRPSTSFSTKIMGDFIDTLLNAKKIDAHQMNLSKCVSIYHFLKDFSPKILFGYVTSLEFFTDFLTERNLPPPKIDSIVTTAETLLEHQKKKMMNKFQCNVYNQYGSSEITGIACECPLHSGLHVSAERTNLEIIKDDEPVSNGETGEIVLTDLDNYQMPLIRYNIEDISSFGDSCKCGRHLPLLKSIKGRTSDIIYGLNGNNVHGEFFSHLIESTGFMDKFHVKQFQVVQKNKNLLKFRISSQIKPQTKDLEIMTNLIKKYLGNISIDYEITNDIPPEQTGKFKFTISEIAH